MHEEVETFHLRSVVCPRRRIDCQKIFDYLEANGMTYTPELSEADLVIVSTCGYIRQAEDDSIKAVKYYMKNKPAHARLIVTGCLPAINKEQLKKIGDMMMISPTSLRELDELIQAKVGFDDIPDPHDIRDFPVSLPDRPLTERLSYAFEPNMRFVKKVLSKVTGTASGSGNKFVSKYNHPLLDRSQEGLYNLRIATGCLGQCSYCAIMSATGSLKSKPLDQVVAEFTEGLSKGYKKFILIAGDTGCYGLDIGTDIVRLLEEILAIDGDYRLIINDFNAQWLVKYRDRLTPLLAGNKDKIDHIILPVQSGSDRILSAMNRPYKIGDVKECLKSMREKVPGLVFTTHIMVGFPDETDEDFEESLGFITEYGFPYVDVYCYEDRPNTASSGLMDKVDAKIMRQRADKILEAQKQNKSSRV
ncbi:radical SAM protein [Candidatus Altiarchaeota archaeon]